MLVKKGGWTDNRNCGRGKDGKDVHVSANDKMGGRHGRTTKWRSEGREDMETGEREKQEGVKRE